MPHQFKDPELEQTALTHSSHGTPHNRRLEWLGEALLFAAVSDLLWERFPGLDPKHLTSLRAPLMRDRILAGAARRAGFPQRLRLGKRRRDGEPANSILAAALKAHVAAVRLDGGDATARTAELLADDLAARARLMARGPEGLKHHPSRLRDFLREAGMSPAVYRCETFVKRGRQLFRVECAAGGRVFVGKHARRPRAENEAAARALRWLE